MSLVVARKIDTKVLILSDTKLTYSGQVTFNRNNGHPLDGTIKTLIIDRSLSISFAGEISFAEEAMKLLGKCNSTTEIKQLLLSKHIESKQQTEFLIVNSAPLTIHHIKNGEGGDVEQSWLGSANAFNRYQGYFLGDLKTENANSVSISMEMQSRDKEPAIFSKMSKAFDSIIDDTSVPEVDGFKIKVGLEGGNFKYFPYVHSYRSSPLEFKIPEAPGIYLENIGHAPAAAGGYTINFFNSSEDFLTVGLHLQQGRLGIIYRREVDGLFIAETLTELDEHDFSNLVKDRFRLTPSGITQIPHVKFETQGDAHFQVSEFREAIENYQKGLNYSQLKIKGRLLYKIGVSYLNLRDLEKAVLNLQEAIMHDSSLQSKAFNLINRYRTKWQRH
jgi:tetratricopeptide (TPR) repeat protein